MGRLDTSALTAAMVDDPDATLAMLMDLTHATDRDLRVQARSAAARLLLPLARPASTPRSGGSGRLATVAAPDGLDLDIDATLERLAERPHLDSNDLRWRAWRRSSVAYVLLVDASGSVSGDPLAAAVVAAASLALRLRPHDELAVVAFWSRAVVLRDVRSAAPATTVLDALFDLRGGDTTDLALGLRTALAQAGMARAGRREVVTLTDGMANEGGDPVVVAAATGAAGARLHVLALPGDDDGPAACARLADAGGGRTAPLLRPSQAAVALTEVLAAL